MPAVVQRRQTDRFRSADRLDLPTIGEFWSWAFSDLASNTTRGILGEFLVAIAVGVEMSRARGAWDDFDFITPEGLRVEVKTTGSVQSWSGRRSAPVFGSLTGRALTPDGAAYEGLRVIRADVFVFSVEAENDPAAYDPLDLSQWDFYVVPAKVIEDLNQRSIRLTRVQTLAPRIGFDQLREAVAAAGKTTPTASP